MSNKLFDIFQNLKTGVLGTKTSAIDQSIDRSLDSINKYTASADRNIYIDTFKQFINKQSSSDLGTVLKDVKETQVEFFDRSGRINRYEEFDAIVRNVAYCSRALNTLTDCIISPDDITKRIIQIQVNQSYEQKEEKETVKRFKRQLEAIKQQIDLERYVERIVRTTLKKGDYFVEILPSPKGTAALTLLSEGKSNSEKDKEDLKVSLEGKQVSFITEDSKGLLHKNKKKLQGGNIIIEGPQTSVSLGGALSTTGSSGGIQRWAGTPTQTPVHIGDFSSSTPDKEIDSKYFKGKHSDEKENKNLELKDIFVTIHNPKYIIRLETERFRNCLGYLVFPKLNLNNLNSRSYSLINSDIDAICMELIKNLKNKLDAGTGINIDNEELKQTIMTYLTSVESGEDLKVRYVPPELMTHFRINVDLHDPYGESIFECVYFDAKLLIALKTAQTIKRLTSATDKRVISVETGLPHNAKNLVEILKESMKKRKVSIDSFGSLDTIASVISTFEDIYIPMRDGKKYVEIDHMQFGPDPERDIEGLKFIRDNIVANLGVPPAFVGLEENATNRNLLTAEDVNFARTIVGYQKEFGSCLLDLFKKIYQLINPNNKESSFDDVEITFPTPKAAAYQHELEYVENATRIIQSLKDNGVSAKYLQSAYLSFLDWDAIQKYETEEELEKQLGTKEEEGGGFGGGGFGGM